jgi:Bacterial regulatory helix-turn-helix protein, lysR family
MELMQMEMFVAVVEEGGVRAASERVFRTEPAVSMAIPQTRGGDWGAALRPLEALCLPADGSRRSAVQIREADARPAQGSGFRAE